MKALRLDAIGAEPYLDRIADPVPGPGEVTVHVAACGLNFADLLMIAGTYQEKPALPVTLGMEIAGTVALCGDGVTGLELGDRIAAVPGAGGLAEVCRVPADRCVRLPEAMSAEHAAAFQIAYGTAHVALRHRAGLRAGETVVVLGAAGGVGLTAVEIARELGARVIAVARGAEKLAIASGAGAETTIDSDTGDLGGELKGLGGVDVVFDAIGNPHGSAALRACKPGARYLAIGFAAGEVPAFKLNYLLVKNIAVHGLYWGGYLDFAPQVVTDSLSELFGWYARGRIRPHVCQTLPLDRATEGLELLRARKSTGKIVITI